MQALSRVMNGRRKSLRHTEALQAQRRDHVHYNEDWQGGEWDDEYQLDEEEEE